MSTYKINVIIEDWKQDDVVLARGAVEIPVYGAAPVFARANGEFPFDGVRDFIVLNDQVYVQSSDASDAGVQTIILSNVASDDVEAYLQKTLEVEGRKVVIGDQVFIPTSTPFIQVRKDLIRLSADIGNHLFSGTLAVFGLDRAEAAVEWMNRLHDELGDDRPRREPALDAGAWQFVDAGLVSGLVAEQAEDPVVVAERLNFQKHSAAHLRALEKREVESEQDELNLMLAARRTLTELGAPVVTRLTVD
ncbi:hypothetical protein LG293_15975 (plasmid) [Citricoccus nitrophenolicus]